MLRAPQWARDAVARFIFDGAKVYALALGSSILMGGPTRMTGPSWTALLQWGDWWQWGASLALFGVLSLVPSYWTRAVCFTLMSMWFFLWASGLLMALLTEPSGIPPTAPHAAFTGVVTYYAIATGYMALCIAMWMARHDWVNDETAPWTSVPER